MNKESRNYRNGFDKGKLIYTENLTKNGYYADVNNKRCINLFRHYAETGYKKDVPLNEGQREYFYGCADGIEYKYKTAGTPIFEKKNLSNFEKRENEHYYGKPKYINDIDDEIFGYGFVKADK